jgi:hypothetical protein
VESKIEEEFRTQNSGAKPGTLRQGVRIKMLGAVGKTRRIAISRGFISATELLHHISRNVVGVQKRRLFQMLPDTANRCSIRQPYKIDFLQKSGKGERFGIFPFPFNLFPQECKKQLIARGLISFLYSDS